MRNMVATAQSQKAFLDWLRSRHPALYSASLNDRATLGGVLDTIGKVFSGVVSNAEKLAAAYVQTKEAKALIELNARRAKEGLLPVDNINTGGQYGATGGMPTWLIPVGVGIIALILLRR